jgi:hypothetical protein
VAADLLLTEIEDALQHHGHHDQGVRLVGLDVPERRRRLEPAPEDERARERERQQEVGIASAVKQRRGVRGHDPRVERDLGQERPQRVQSSGGPLARRPWASPSFPR